MKSGTRPTLDALARSSRRFGLLRSSMPYYGYLLWSLAVEPFLFCIIHVESVCKMVDLYACPEGPKAWSRRIPISSCTIPSHPFSDRMAFTYRPPQNVLYYFAWGNSSGPRMDPGVAPGSSAPGCSP
eukprot:5768151-Pyramimonas_sp.AAC.1